MANDALRFNQGKPDYTLLDFQSLEPMVRVLEFGARKYARDNWRKGLAKENILGSLQRHVGKLIDKVNQGKDEVDDETGIHEIGHIFCNCMFYSALHVNKQEMGRREEALNGFDWNADERAKKSESKPELDPEDAFYQEYGRFPSRSELREYIEDQDYSDEEDESDWFEREEEDEPPLSDIDEILERGEELERLFRRPCLKSIEDTCDLQYDREESPKPVYKKPELKFEESKKSTKFVADKAEEKPRSTRGLGFRVHEL